MKDERADRLEQMCIAIEQAMDHRFGVKGEAAGHCTEDGEISIRFFAKPVNARSLVLDLLQQGLTQGALAKQVGVHTRTIYSWLHGANPKAPRLKKLRDLHAKKVRVMRFIVGADEW